MVALLFLFRLPDPWNVRLPIYLIVLVLSILRPRIALYLIPIAVPWGSVDTIVVGKLNTNSADILVAFLAIGWLLSYSLPSLPSNSQLGPRDRAFSNVVPPLFIVAIVTMISVMILSISVATSISSSLKEISKWLEFLVLVLIGSQYIRTRRHIWTIIVIVCLAGITQAFYGYVQAFFNIGPSAFVRDASLRVYGTFGQPNPYAGYINMPLSITAALTFLGSNKTTRAIAAIATALLATAEYLTLSRGGEVAIIAALWLILMLGVPQLRSIMGLLITAILGVIELLLSGIVPTSLASPLLAKLGLAGVSLTSPSTQDYSTAERLAHWIAGIRMFQAHPFLGVGIGNFPDVYSNYYVTIFVNSLGHAHNYYINIAAETGVIGFCAFAFFLIAMFVSGGHSLRNINSAWQKARQQQVEPARPVQAPLGTPARLSLLAHPWKLVEYYQSSGNNRIVNLLANDRALAIGLLAALLSVCVHNFVDDLYVHSMTNLIALLLIALIRLEKVTPDVEINKGGHGG